MFKDTIQKLKHKIILKVVSSYIKTKKKTKWVAGKDWIHYSGPFFNEKEYTAAITSLLSEWLILGETARKFEKKFAPKLGKADGVVVNSGSSANLLMLAAMKSKRLYNLPVGSKFITPVLCFPTTLNPIIQNGFEPVFVDVTLPSLNLDLDQVEAILKLDTAKEIKGIIFAHVLGNPPDMDRVMRIVKEYNLIFLEDACDALGSKWKGQVLGSFGHLSSCSFFPAHHMTMGEGGFVGVNTMKERIVVSSLRDWGRACFKAGTPINCGESIKNIEQISIGDVVTTHLGNSKRVTELFQRDFDGNYYTFTCRLRNKVESTDNHTYYVQFKNGKRDWVEAKDIKVGDCLLERLPNEQSGDKFFEWKYNTLYKTVTKKLKAEPDLMRLIGYWLAEGTVSKGLKGGSGYPQNKYFAYSVAFSFNKNEVEYMNDVKYLMKKYFNVTCNPTHNKFKGNSFEIGSKSRMAYEFFLQHFGKLAYGKKLPLNMVNWNSELTSQLVNGFWRGDGSQSATKKLATSYSICSTSFTLLEQLRRILLKHNILSSYFVCKKENRQNDQILNGYTVNAKHDLHTIAIYGENAKIFAEDIINDIKFVRNQENRQYAIISEDGLYACYPVASIDITPIHETVYNIEVEDDHSYHAHGVSVHNCHCNTNKPGDVIDGTACGNRFKCWFKGHDDIVFDHRYVFDEIGYNLKPIEMQTAIGLEQIDKLDEMHARRKKNHARLYEIFYPYRKYLYLPNSDGSADVSWFGFLLTIKDGAPFTKDQLMSWFEHKKVQTRSYFTGNALLHPAYVDQASKYANPRTDFPVATKSTLDSFFLGVYPGITDEQLDYIEVVVERFMRDYFVRNK